MNGLSLRSTQIITSFPTQIPNVIIGTFPSQITTKGSGVTIPAAKMQGCVPLEIAQINICPISQRKFYKSFIPVLA
jgi:hypothetical protein